jgi:hypothetical protein
MTAIVLIVQREGKTVRLFSRNGNDWSGRYPWIVEGRAEEQARPVRDRWRGSGARRRRHRGLQRPALAQAQP